VTFIETSPPYGRKRFLFQFTVKKSLGQQVIR
jgi:hypothetical protein